MDTDLNISTKNQYEVMFHQLENRAQQDLMWLTRFGFNTPSATQPALVFLAFVNHMKSRRTENRYFVQEFDRMTPVGAWPVGKVGNLEACWAFIDVLLYAKQKLEFWQLRDE